MLFHGLVNTCPDTWGIFHTWGAMYLGCPEPCPWSQGVWIPALPLRMPLGKLVNLWAQFPHLLNGDYDPSHLLDSEAHLGTSLVAQR